MKTLCIVGYGYWGSILLNSFISHKEFEIKYICDRNRIKLAQAKRIVPDNCILITDPKQAFEDPAVDLIVIATQAAYHFDLCVLALKANKHIFVEKPFTLSSLDAKYLYQMAFERNRKIWIDHTFLFTHGYQKLKHCLQSGMIGKPLRFHSTRTAFGPFRENINAIWDLMVHDIYILLDLFQSPEKINSVISTASIIPHNVDSVIAGFTFPNQLHATVHCDMLFAQKKREIVVSGDKGILVWDEMHQDKLAFYPYCASHNPEIKKMTYQLDKMQVVQCEAQGALFNEIDALSSFLNKQNRLTFPEEHMTLEIIRLLELIETMDKQSCRIAV